MGVEPNAWSRALPVLCADLLRHWERDARFLCCQKIHIQFSTAEPGGSVYLPRGAFRNQVDGASGRPRPTAGIESLRGGGASPRPTENYPSKSGRPHGAAPTGLICLVLLGTFQRKGLRAAKGRPYREGKILWGGRVRTPAPTRMQGRSCSPRRGRSQTGPRAHTVRPYSGKRTWDVGSETAGAEVGPHRLQFSSRSGPQWGRTEPRSSTPDFVRRKCSAHFKG